jgi:hypothetical protein
LPVKCSWPTSSDKFLGLIRSASGVWGAGIIKIKRQYYNKFVF